MAAATTSPTADKDTTTRARRARTTRPAAGPTTRPAQGDHGVENAAATRPAATAVSPATQRGARTDRWKLNGEARTGPWSGREAASV